MALKAHIFQWIKVHMIEIKSKQFISSDCFPFKKDKDVLISELILIVRIILRLGIGFLGYDLLIFETANISIIEQKKYSFLVRLLSTRSRS